MDLSIREILKADTEIKQNRNFIFKPTEEECDNGLMHICYSSANDTYVRKSSDDAKSESWLDSTYSCTNMFRKVEGDWDMTYLARDEVRSPPGGEVSWRFDVNGTDSRMDKLELRAPCYISNDGCIIWTICTDKHNFVQTGSLTDFVTFELQGATSLSITAFLTGGLGCTLYQHAQLFRQELYVAAFGFEIKLFLESESARSIRSQAEIADKVVTLAERCGGYIFTPYEEECRKKAMNISYNSLKDCYIRHSSDNTTLSSWLQYTYSTTNIFRKQEDSGRRAYLAMKEGTYFGKASWKFDVRDSGLKLKFMRMRAPRTVHDAGSVVWLICSGKQCYMETGDELNKLMTFELEGSTELSITVFLSGGTENESWRQAQLFGRDFSIELELEEDPRLAERATVTEPSDEKVDIPKEMSEMGNNFIFKPTEEEIAKNIMHICYSCTNDTYVRKSSNNETLYSWQNCTLSHTNVFRKEDRYKWMTSLVREDSDQHAEVSWKFDVKEIDLRMLKVEIRASSAVSETGSVLWTISSKKDIHTSESLQEPTIFHLSDASTLTITASLKGGKWSNAWEHSQLFPQSTDDVESFPFEVKIFMDFPVSNSAVGGNIDASNWKQPRGTFGIPAEICKRVNNSFVFKPTKDELASNEMHICYSCATDSYSRRSDQMPSWLDYTFSSTNMYRKEEHDHDKVYLARIEGTQFAEVTWKFDVTGTGFKMDKMELRAVTALYSGAYVLWTICAGKQTFIKTAHYFKNFESSQIFDLNGAQTMTITAFLAGGEGLVAWQHSQIFRQGMYDEDDFPFDVKILLETISPVEHEGELGLPATICSQINRHYVFQPAMAEIERKLMHVGYSTTQNEYVRLLGVGDSCERLPSWKDGIYSCKNLFLEEDYENQMSYIGRQKGTQFAEVTWKFDVKYTDDLCMDVLELTALTDLYGDGCVIWTIQADEKKFIQTGTSLNSRMIFELSGSKELSITAFLAGGKSVNSWVYTQLFPQKMDDEPSDTSFPFEVKLFLKHET